MGMSPSKLLSTLLWPEKVRLLMLGLDGVGKTHILHQLQIGEVCTHKPMETFVTEFVDQWGLVITSWDLGGSENLRGISRYYYERVHGAIFVVDSCERDRIDDETKELESMLYSEEMKNKPILVMANKQDYFEALPVIEIATQLEKNADGLKDRSWFVQGTSAATGQGLKEGLKWIITTIEKQNKTIYPMSYPYCSVFKIFA